MTERMQVDTLDSIIMEQVTRPTLISTNGAMHLNTKALTMFRETSAPFPIQAAITIPIRQWKELKSHPILQTMQTLTTGICREEDKKKWTPHS